MQSRLKALLAISLVAVSLVLLFAYFGYEQGWRLWNVQAMPPGFADLRVITHGADAVAKGLDPLISNPGNPLSRRMNYPRIWQGLYLLGINKSHTIPLGIGIILSFLAGVIMILPNASNRTLFLVAGALVSPAVVLGVERCNTDLFIFFLVASSILIARKYQAVADAVIMFATALKLYPIFGLSILLKVDRRRFVKHVLIVFAVLLVYLFTNLSELKLISQATPRSTDLSYGMNVVWMGIATINPSYGRLSYFMCILFVIFAACLLLVACRHPYNQKESDEAPLSLDAFRVGSCIYIGTFLLGNNWDYRLIFLIFTIPQLSFWSISSSRKLRWCSWVGLGAILVSMWYMVILKIWGIPLGGFKYSAYPWAIDEMSNWTLFFLLAYLFALSLPQWAKDIVLHLFRLTRRPA